MLKKKIDINLLNNQEGIFNNYLSYWKQRLTDVPPFLELPVDYPRLSQNSYSTANFSFLFSKLLSDELTNLGQKWDANIFITMLAAFKTLIYRYTNQEDIIILGFSNNRQISNVNESGKLVKRRLNKMILRTDLSGDPVFWELLQRERETVLEAEANQEFPFDTLIKSIHIEGLNIDSLFQIQFEFCRGENVENSKAVLTESDEFPLFDLRLSIEETNQELVGKWEYNSSLFEVSTISQMANHFHNLLVSIVSNPDQPISKLSLLSTPERIQILFEWNQTNTAYPDDKCIHELFEEQVERTPDSLAVELYEAEGVSFSSTLNKITYHELNVRANQLAHYLRNLGVGPEIVIGIYVKRSVEMVVGLLGILKAGGSYMPLDPGYPKERLEFMLKDSGVSILLTQHLLRKAIAPHNVHILYLDTDWDTITTYSDKNVISGVKPNNLAYVIYTSGSTGTPKGTLIIHQGVVNYLNWCIKEYAVAEGSGAPVNSSIAFDATVTSFFAPLLAGKRIMLLPEVGEIEALSAVLLSENCFSLVKITPAHLEILRHLKEGQEIDGQTNSLVIGGEALSTKNLELWRTHAPRTRLINEYGPTETVVGCCTYTVPREGSLSKDIPIGRPIANTQMYILDRNMEPVPIGVSGEIYIGGAGLARGYLNRPDLTEQRFVPNPFSDHPNARLYKTGDLARYLRDGNIVFQGRIDCQVKIRGYRIELGEIESALDKHPGLRHVAVIAREDNPGDKRLVAYLVAKEKLPSINNLRLFLGDKLPEYMIPALFVFLKALPLTSNGKVNRKALPVPDQKRCGTEKSYTAPRDSAELALTKIFETCLNIPSIGVNDDFFELGANSIQIAIAFAQIKKTFGKSLPLTTIIRAPTIGKLGVFIRGERESDSWSSLVPIQPHGTKPPLFCMHAGGGHILIYRSLAMHLGSDQPLYGLQAKGLNGNDNPNTSIEEMASHYISEIRTLQPQGPYYLAGYCLGGILAFEMAQQLKREGHEVAFLASFNGFSSTYVHSRRSRVIEEGIEMPVSKKQISIKQKHTKKGTISHFKARIIYSLKLLNRTVNTHIRMLGYKVYKAIDRPLPRMLRKNYCGDNNPKIAKAYIAQPYSGRMYIFYSPQIFRDSFLGWDGLLKDGIETFPMPGDYRNRQEIMGEPFVQFLAEELKKHLMIQNQKESV